MHLAVDFDGINSTGLITIGHTVTARDRNDLDDAAAVLCIVQLELGTVQQLMIRAVHLEQVELVGVSGGLLIDGLLVAVVQGCAVLVASNNGVLIQSSGVGHNNILAYFVRNIAVCEGEGEGGVAIILLESQRGVVIVESFVIDLDAAGDKAQALLHGIGDLIALCTGLHMDGDLELHSITDLGVVGGTPGITVLDLFLDGGLAVLFLDGDIGGGGIQAAQSTQRAVHQVVAQVQVREGDGITSCGFLSARDLLISCPGQSCLSKCGNSGGIVFVSSRPSGVVLAVQGDVVSTGTRLEETLPSRFYGVGIGIAFSVVAV